MKNKILLQALSLLMCLSVAGCGGMGKKKGGKTEDLIRTAELKQTMAEINIKIEELNNKFLLLQEKVESIRENVGDSAGTKPVEDEKPPTGLKVIKLTKADVEKSKAKGIAEKDKKIKKLSASALYRKGQDLFIVGKYGDARKHFEELVGRFPDNDLADNALYWAGESHYSEQDYVRALVKFEDVVDRYPEGNKAPDSLLKAAFSYMELDDKSSALDTFKSLIEKYPTSAAANRAKRKISNLK